MSMKEDFSHDLEFTINVLYVILDHSQKHKDINYCRVINGKDMLYVCPEISDIKFVPRKKLISTLIDCIIFIDLLPT